MVTSLAHGHPDARNWPGVPAGCSRYIDVVSSADIDAGTTHRWHILDNAAQLEVAGRQPVGTLLCVHGNPTWSYLWRSLLTAAAQAEQPWRVIAVDQLGMGYSARTGPRRLPDRVRDLGDLTRTLGLDADHSGPVVTVGHDWGGSISLGWAVDHPDLLAGVVLTNTAVHQPEGEQVPWPLRLALHPAVHRTGTVSTTAFLDVTMALATPALDPEVRSVYRAPYGSAADRASIGKFVADIPVDLDDPSRAELDRIAEGVRKLDVPALLLWGPEDPVFSDKYLIDLIDRLPHADVHRFEGASHLLAEDAPVAETVVSWLGSHVPERERASHRRNLSDDRYRPLWSRLEERANDDATAMVDMSAPSSDGGPTRLSWAQLNSRVERLARGLRAIGVEPGDRVSLLVPPGIDLTCFIYACMRIGAVIVVADAGLGAKGLSRAIRGAGPRWLVGIERALIGARLYKWPGRKISLSTPGPLRRRALNIDYSLAEILSAGDRSSVAIENPGPDDLGGILFTSGSTGPAKGVRYTNRQLSAMCRAIQETYGLAPGTGLVAAFAPFALLGPALGATSVSPAMDVTAPRTLTASALADACAAIEATAVFASPAALTNILATASELTPAHREALGNVNLLLSAGAPISAQLVEAVSELVPAAEVHTPYGMTEALPITDIDAATIRAVAAEGDGNGVCVGTPVHGAVVAICPLDHDGVPVGDPTSEAGATGEILVAAPHVKDKYDRLYITETASGLHGWHRTGDVGHLDAAGRLWVEGRLGHVIVTDSGPLTPVRGELAVDAVDGISRSALVGVGPRGTQAVVVIVETEPRARRDGPAEQDVVDAVRAAVPDINVAAVLTVRDLPTDVRHNSKIDRAALARWAEAVLSGAKVAAP